MFDLTSFNEEFIPSKILFRENEVAEFTELFRQFKVYKRSSNYIVYGYTGCGKSAIILKVLEEEKDNSLYINGAEIRTSLGIINQIAKSKNLNPGVVLQETQRILLENPKVLILDEINDLKDPYNLFEYLNAIWRKTQVPIILISNKHEIAVNIEPDAEQTLFFRRVDLSSYDARQIKEIIDQRIKLIPDLQISEEVVSFIGRISAHAAKGGSARIALYMMKEALRRNDFTAEFFEKLVQELKLQDWRSFFLSLSGQEREIIKILLERTTPTTGIEILEIYKSKQFVELHPSRVSQIVSNIERNQGLIIREYINKGKGKGRSAIVKFLAPNYYYNMREVFEKEGIQILNHIEIEQNEKQSMLNSFGTIGKEVQTNNG